MSFDEDHEARVQAELLFRQQEARRMELKDLSEVLDTAEGRRFVHRLLNITHIHAPTFVAGAPEVTSYNEGKRAVGLVLMADINAHFLDQFLLMLKEHATHG